MAMPEGLLGASRAAPNRRRSRESPRGSAGRETGKGSGPSRDPNGVQQGGFGLRAGLRESGKAFGRRRDPKRGFWGLRPREVPRTAGRLQGPHQSTALMGPRAQRLSKGRPERLRPRCEPWRRRGFGRAGSDPGSGGGISVPLKRPDGDRRGAFGPLPKPTGCRTGPRGLAPGSGGKRSGRSRPPRDPKPPSERWPRHPATAVKAGTSGGRWRHRPPL